MGALMAKERAFLKYLGKKMDEAKKRSYFCWKLLPQVYREQEMEKKME